MQIKQILPTMMLLSAPVVSFAQGAAGIKAENLDRSVNPATDFYQFATGGWQKLHPLPAAYSRYGSFDLLQENNNKRINSILTSLLKSKNKKGSVEQKLGDFYRLATDSVRRNKEGIAPVKPLLDEMEQAKSIADLNALRKKYAIFGYGEVAGTFFGADEKNATQNIFNVYQGGLTLGQKEYYLDNDKATTDIRNAYKRHIVNMFKLFGFTTQQAEQKRDAIIRFETMLALVSKNRTELRDPEANYNKMTLKEFEQKYPNLDIEAMANASGIKSEYIQTMVVGQPKFLEGLDKIIATQEVEELRARMEWDVIMSSANYLSDDIRAEYFNFFSKTMRGAKEDFPRWKRATLQIENLMGEALGRIYCKRYFTASSKQRMINLINNLKSALSDRINAQDWMSEKTKKAAQEKLATFYVKVGYPDKWKDISALVIDPTKSYYDNVLAARAFWAKQEIKEKAGKPVDRDEWGMTPQTVNAYYNPTTNEICFPAGILQYPFFDAKADDAFNYGAIGVVIGHEMTHGFDDQGRKYDKNGNMSDWWTDADSKKFDERTGKYADFFSAIKVLPDLNANGKFTLGENLADHGGLQVAYAGLQKVSKTKRLKNLLGFTPEQRFFLAYAGVWANNITEAEIRNRVKSDPHSLGKWRVNGALPHIDECYKAFNVKSTDKMYLPENERLKLW